MSRAERPAPRRRSPSRPDLLRDGAGSPLSPFYRSFFEDECRTIAARLLVGSAATPGPSPGPAESGAPWPPPAAPLVTSTPFESSPPPAAGSPPVAALLGRPRGAARRLASPRAGGRSRLARPQPRRAGQLPPLAARIGPYTSRQETRGSAASHGADSSPPSAAFQLRRGTAPRPAPPGPRTERSPRASPHRRAPPHSRPRATHRCAPPGGAAPRQRAAPRPGALRRPAGPARGRSGGAAPAEGRRGARRRRAHGSGSALTCSGAPGAAATPPAPPTAVGRLRCAPSRPVPSPRVGAAAAPRRLTDLFFFFLKL